MGKDGELWDDSALINAFDDAISKYKKMHGKGGHDGSINEGKATSGIEEKVSVLTDKCLEAKSHLEADANNVAAPKNTAEVGDTFSPSLIDENHSTEAFVLEHHVCSSNGHHTQETEGNCANTQGTEDYNHLINQYNELEERRQKVLQQLYQYGGWNYQGYDTSVQEGTFYASQEHHVPAAHASCPTAVCTCRSYVCPFPTTPCTSMAACCSSATCAVKTCDATSAIAQNGSSVSLEDGDLVKIAMGVAEKALCSLKIKASVIPEVNDEKGNAGQTTVAELGQNKDSKTDLSVVLNAWFSAGFYTGKYLSEQSTAKK